MEVLVTTGTDESASVTKRESAKEYQLEFVAQMSVLGIPVDTMSASTGLSVGYINRLFDDKRNGTFNKIRDAHLKRRTKEIVGGHYRLADMLEEAYAGVRDSIQCNDARVKAENSWKLIDRVVPDLNKPKNGQQGGIQLILNQPEIQTQVGIAMTTVAEAISGLREVIRGQDPDEHVLEGTDALPTPPSQLEVSEGGAPLEVERKDPSDLLTELIDEVEE